MADEFKSDFSEEETELRFNALLKACLRKPLTEEERGKVKDMDKIYNTGKFDDGK